MHAFVPIVYVVLHFNRFLFFMLSSSYILCNAEFFIFIKILNFLFLLCFLFMGSSCFNLFWNQLYFFFVRVFILMVWMCTLVFVMRLRKSFVLSCCSKCGGKGSIVIAISCILGIWLWRHFMWSHEFEPSSPHLFSVYLLAKAKKFCGHR